MFHFSPPASGDNEHLIAQLTHEGFNQDSFSLLYCQPRAGGRNSRKLEQIQAGRVEGWDCKELGGSLDKKGFVFSRRKERVTPWWGSRWKLREAPSSMFAPCPVSEA